MNNLSSHISSYRELSDKTSIRDSEPRRDDSGVLFMVSSHEWD